MDDFTDGVIASSWSLIEDAPSQLRLAEQNGRVEALATNPVNNAIDALYLSEGPTGFRLSTASNFEVTLDYNLTQSNVDASTAVSGDLLGLVFGVGRDLDGTDSAAIGYGIGRLAFGPLVFTETALAAAYRIDDQQTEEAIVAGRPDAGTFRIAYDAAGDDLTLGITDTATGSAVLEDTVQGIWNADALYVSLGARGGGFSFASGDAWLDNFRVVSGDLLPLPGPLLGDYDRNGTVAQGDLNLVLNNWGQARVGWSNDDGFASNTVDQEELNRVLNNWGSTVAPILSVSAIPEPTAAGWLGLCGLLRLRGRRHEPRASREPGISLA
ncbi:MAG: hypothetical protein AAF916_09950 [Planctomycetota bacterium]